MHVKSYTTSAFILFFRWNINNEKIGIVEGEGVLMLEIGCWRMVIDGDGMFMLAIVSVDEKRYAKLPMVIASR